MQQGIHPKYHEDATIKCACGAVYETGSTTKDLEIEICAKCHPFYTGKKKYVDTTGRVDRFKKLAEKAEKKKTAAKKHASKEEKASKKAEKKEAVAAK